MPYDTIWPPTQSDPFKRHDFIPRGKVWVTETDIHCVDGQLPRLSELSAHHLEINVFKGKLGEGGHSALPRDVVVEEMRRMLATTARVSPAKRILGVAKKVSRRAGIGRLLADRLFARRLRSKA